MPDFDLPPSVRAALYAGLGDEPPLRLTVADVLARGRRARRRRQIAHAAGGLATASLVVGVTTVTVATLHGSPTGTAVPPAHPGGAAQPTAPTASGTRPVTPAATSPPVVRPGHGVTPPGTGPTSPTGSTLPFPTATEAPAAATARLDAVLNAALPLPPGAHRVRVGVSWSAKPGGFYPSQGGYKATMDITDRAGTGNLFIDVYGPATAVGPLRCPPAEPGTTCTVRSDRSVVTVSREELPHGVVRWSVGEQRPDGSAVSAMELNYGQNSVPQVKNPPDPVAQRATPPLSIAQLTALVHNPGLSYSPPR
jgi:hypothetical protein